METLRMTAAILFLTLILGACNDNNDSKYGDDVNIIVNIRYLNQQGENLLDTATEGHFNKDEIKLFYEQNEKLIEQNGSKPKEGYIWIEADNTGDLFLIVDPPIPDESNHINTYLKLNENDMDTLEAYISVNLGQILADTVWYNGEMKPHSITVIK